MFFFPLKGSKTEMNFFFISKKVSLLALKTFEYKYIYEKKEVKFFSLSLSIKKISTLTFKILNIFCFIATTIKKNRCLKVNPKERRGDFWQKKKFKFNLLFLLRNILERLGFFCFYNPLK